MWHTWRVAPIAFLEHKSMIVNFMTIHTHLLSWELPAETHYCLSEKRQKGRNPFFNFFFSKYECLFPMELIKALHVVSYTWAFFLPTTLRFIKPQGRDKKSIIILRNWLNAKGPTSFWLEGNRIIYAAICMGWLVFSLVECWASENLLYQWECDSLLCDYTFIFVSI